MNRKLWIPLAVLVVVGTCFWYLMNQSGTPSKTDSESARSTKERDSESPTSEAPDSAATTDTTSAEPVTTEVATPTGPPLLEGLIHGEGKGIAGAKVLFFPVSEIENTLLRFERLAPTSGQMPDIPKLIDAAKAEIYHLKDIAIVVESDEDGVYRLYEAEDGGLIVLSMADGWLFQYGDVVAIQHGRTARLDVELDRGASIAGKVVDATGNGVDGLHVIAEYRPPGMPAMGRIVRKFLSLVNGEFLKGPFERVTSNGGHFEISSLPPGVYDLTAYNDAGLETSVRSIETGTTGTVIFFGDGGSIFGELVDDAGVPVPDVKITLERVDEMITLPLPMAGFNEIGNLVNRYLQDRPKVSTSLEDGTFTFGPLGDGAYRIAIEHPGYFSISRAVEVAWNERVDLGRVEMRRGERFTGVVRAADGGPLEGASVTVFPSNPGMMNMGSMMKDLLTGRVATTTDADGRFVLAGLKKDTYTIVASYSTYAPEAKPDLKPSESEPLEFELKPGATIVGSVLSAVDDHPIAGARVRVGEARAESDADGHFELLGVVAGGGGFPGPGMRARRFQRQNEGPETVSVRAQAKSYIDGRVEVELGDTREVVLRLDAAPVITGLVLDPDGKPVPGALVRLAPAMPEDMQVFSFIDTSLFFVGVTVADLEGRFRFESYFTLQGGEFNVLADHPQFARGFSQAFRFSELPPEYEVAVQLRSSGRVHGVVTDGRAPLAGATVRLRKVQQVDPQAGMMMSMLGLPKSGETVQTNSDGEYTFERVIAGDYEVNAEMVGFTDTESKEVHVVDGGDFAIDFAVDPGISLAGRVTDDLGNPLPEARVRLIKEEGEDKFIQAQRFLGGAYKATVTDQDGNYRIDGIADDIYRIVAEKKGFASTELTGVMAANGAPEIQLTPSADLRVFVVDSGSGRGLGEFEIAVQSHEPGWESFNFGRQKVSHPDGLFEQLDQRPGDYTVTVSAAGYINTESKVMLRPGELTEVRVPLDRGGTIVGRVVDKRGTPVADADVSISDWNPEEKPDPSASLRRAWRNGMDENRTDADGYYRIEGVPPTPQKVLVTHDDYMDGSRTDIVVALGEEVRVDVELEQGLLFSGHLLNESGRPMPNQYMFLTSTGDDVGVAKSGMTDDKGAFHFAGLKKGTYRLMVPQRGTASSSGEVIDLTKGDVEDYRLQLSAEGS